MGVEEELATLSNPISLPEPMKSAPKVINFLSTIPEDKLAPETRLDIFLIDGLGGITLANKVQDAPRPSSRSRPAIPLGFNFDTPQSAFSFGRWGTGTSQPTTTDS